MNETKNKIILIVEDDEEIGFLLEMMLEREGFTIERAADGLEASEKIASLAKVDLILLDVMLPYKDGFHLLEEIKNKWQDTPTIMLTAKSQEQDITRALTAGANDYIVKPFQTHELLARIKRLLN